MNTLAIDIGGTKFSMAVVRRRPHGAPRVAPHRSRRRPRMDARRRSSNDRARMAARVPVRALRHRLRRAGEFRRAARGALHARGRLARFPSDRVPGELLGVPAIMDNDANAGALGEARLRRRPRLLAAVLHDALHRHRRRHLLPMAAIWRGADSYGGEIGHLTIRPDGPECLCGASAVSSACAAGLWLERDYGKTAKELMRDPDFVRRYVVDLALGLKACIMLLNPARIVIGGGIGKAGERAVRSACARNWAGRSRTGRRHASMWCRRRWGTTACCTARWHWLKDLMNFPAAYKKSVLEAIERIDLDKVESGHRLVPARRAKPDATFSCAATAAALPRRRTSPAIW